MERRERGRRRGGRSEPDAEEQRADEAEHTRPILLSALLGPPVLLARVRRLDGRREIHGQNPRVDGRAVAGMAELVRRERLRDLGLPRVHANEVLDDLLPEPRALACEEERSRARVHHECRPGRAQVEVEGVRRTPRWPAHRCSRSWTLSSGRDGRPSSSKHWRAAARLAAGVLAVELVGTPDDRPVQARSPSVRVERGQ